MLKTLRDYTHGKNAVWGVTARNREQNFALNLLMDPECDFITLTGSAGTGKTLMTLAAGLAQVLDERRYTEIIVTRVTVPVSYKTICAVFVVRSLTTATSFASCTRTAPCAGSR